MVKIWGRANSTNVKKVLWGAEELGLDYERIDAGGAFGVVDGPDYRAKNPNGLVPLLEDGDLVLWESNVILRYLAARYGVDSLWIADAGRRAQAEKWMDWVTGTLAPPFGELFRAVVRTAPEARDPARIEALTGQVNRLLAIADGELAKQPYLSGEGFGIGDIPLGCVAHGWFAIPVKREELPALRDWYSRLLERSAYRKVVAIPLS